MKTIDGFCIKEIILRNPKDVWGKTNGNRRIHVSIDDELHKKITKITKKMGIKTTELFRILGEEFSNQIHMEEIDYDTY